MAVAVLKDIKGKELYMKKVIVHRIDVTHYRLVELCKLADQAKPFYDWVEKQAKKITDSHQDFNEIIMSSSKFEIKEIIIACSHEVEGKRPFLFDGIGRVYPHNKACFYFFAWIIRDAPQQRLAPLISKMKKQEEIKKDVAERDTLSELIYEYRTSVKSFSWLTVREVIIDRLEGSRRSLKGHEIEASVRAALVTAFQNYFSIYGDYGKYKIEIADKQIQIGDHTIDVSAKLTPIGNGEKKTILIPIKTRETEGGGHSHLFTRDITAAVGDLKRDGNIYHIISVIIALNWSVNELTNINNQIDEVFYLNMNPNEFLGFDEAHQIRLNKYVRKILKNDE